MSIIPLGMSKITEIRVREIETAITFYLKTGLSQIETWDKISSNFDISSEEAKKIAGKKLN